MATLTIEIGETELEALRVRAQTRGGDVAPENIVAELIEKSVRENGVYPVPVAEGENGVGASSYDALFEKVRLTPERLAERRAATIARFGLDKPRSDGKHWSDAVVGRWPGDETDQEINEALEKIS